MREWEIGAVENIGELGADDLETHWQTRLGKAARHRYRSLLGQAEGVAERRPRADVAELLLEVLGAEALGGERRCRRRWREQEIVCFMKVLHVNEDLGARIHRREILDG